VKDIIAFVAGNVTLRTRCTTSKRMESELACSASTTRNEALLPGLKRTSVEKDNTGKENYFLG